MRGCIGAISLNYGRRIPIFRGRLRAPFGRTGHFGLPPCPLLPERALARRVSAVPGNVSFAAHPPGLTRREQEVLDLICADHRNAQIAAKCSSPPRLPTITSRPCWRNWMPAPVTLPPHTMPGSAWSAPRKDRKHRRETG